MLQAERKEVLKSVQKGDLLQRVTSYFIVVY